MPIYIPRKINYSPPPPSDIQDVSDADFIQDPEKIYDELPQPYRMLNKILYRILDNAWDQITVRESKKDYDQNKHRPSLKSCNDNIQMEGNIKCLQKTIDSRYVICGLENSLIWLNAETKKQVGSWQKPNTTTVKIETGILSVDCYIICTIDDLGIARLFLGMSEGLQFIHQFNNDSGITCDRAEISHYCDYIGLFLKSAENGHVDIYKVQTDSWKKECENMVASMQNTPLKVVPNTQSSNSLPDDEADIERRNSTPNSPKSVRGGVKFSSMPTIILRVKSPSAKIDGVKYPNISSISKIAENTDEVIGTGANHIVSQFNLVHRNDAFSVLHENLLKYSPKEPPLKLIPEPTFHLLSNNDFLIWWSDEKNFLRFNLLKTAKESERNVTSASDRDDKTGSKIEKRIKKNKDLIQDIERKPDSVTPVRTSISHSAVKITDTQTFFAVTTIDGNLTLWNLRNNIPLKSLSVGSFIDVCKLSWSAESFWVEKRDGSVIQILPEAGRDNDKILFPGDTTEDERRTWLLAVNPKVYIIVYDNHDISVHSAQSWRAHCRIDFKLPDDEIYQPSIVSTNSIVWIASGMQLAWFDLLEINQLQNYFNIYNISLIKDNEKNCSINDLLTRSENMLSNRIKRQGDRKLFMQDRWNHLKQDLNAIKSMKYEPTVDVTISSLTRSSLNIGSLCFGYKTDDF